MSSSTVISTNPRAINAHKNLSTVGSKQDKASKRLSSGLKINSAADDAAGLAISQKMKAQIRGLDMASKNSQDATSLAETTEGYLTEVTNMVQRVRELAVQSATDTNTDDDRKKLQAEVTDLQSEITSMAGRAQFNKKSLSSTSALKFHVGSNSSQTISFTLQQFDAGTLGMNCDISSQTGADGAITTCDNALGTINTYRAKLGALQNRLEYTNTSLQTASENLSTANSRIEDADMASEMTSLTSANVIQQAATSMLAQANQSSQTILSLLQ